MYKKRFIKHSLLRMFHLKKNEFSPKIFVCLHLYYPDSWKEIRQYLLNLKFYDFDLYITYVTDDDKTKRILKKIKKEYPNCVCKLVENKGYDIGPFFTILESIDLDKYDIVIKLHSKGVNRKTTFIYNCLFHPRDWFLYLYEGILSAKNVNSMVKSLLTDNGGIVASKKIVVKDTYCKTILVNKFITENHVKLRESYDYNFVAGSVFAIKASILRDFKNLIIPSISFEFTKRGVFSEAHVLERLICIYTEQIGKQILGLDCCSLLQLKNKIWENKLKNSVAYNLISKDDIKKYHIDPEFFVMVENTFVKSITDEKICLGKLNRKWYDGKYYLLKDCAPYKYLKGEKEQYQRYCEYHQKHNLPYMSIDRFEELIKSLKVSGYKKDSRIVIDNNNTIMDGQHRSCYLLYEYGEEYIVDIVRITYKKLSPSIIKTIIKQLVPMKLLFLLRKGL